MDVDELVGCFVVEIGVRLAWPYVGFCDNQPSRARETRLYIDAPWSFNELIAEDDDQWLHTARKLNLATIERAWVGGAGELHLVTAEGDRLAISGEATANTVGEPWRFTRWQQT
ncbi:hypothetical protein [Paractinoplanes globisporus]|uniref:Uncharacterized protein n=1 Tax=Paractinoplanes globisporus TaxID=113565 RepID=A0ABW6WRR6_9ACTN|nr:hypothetical protein [Actinoplanes globisporus]